MKSIAVLGLIVVTLGCIAEPEPVPDAPLPDPQSVTGPGTAVSADGVPIAYTVYGTGEPALVLIHGWLCNQSFWSEQVPVFSENHTVVTVDLAGHGQSGMNREGWPLMAFGADVRSVIDTLGLNQVVLVGHSMGGPVALEAARLMPNRVVGVIAVDSLQNADFKYDPEQQAGFIAAMEEDFPTYCNRMVTGMFQDGANQAIVERVRSDMCSRPADIGIAMFAQYVQYDMGGALAALDVPVRSLNADKWPTDVAANRAYQPNYDAVIIPETGHFLMMDAADRFNPMLAEVISEIVQPI